MRVFHRDIDKTRKGHMVMMADAGEDMWHVYNIIGPGDSLKATTFRKVQSETATGSTTKTKRVRINVTLQVETTDFDASACLLRVKGRNIAENEHVKMGAYHTIDLEPSRRFTLHKEHWDSVTWDRIDAACDPKKHAEVAAITMQEGLAYVVLITAAMTVDRAKIDLNIPKKGKPSDTQRKKALTKFYSQVAAAVQRHLDLTVLKAVLVASPGFIKDDFFAFLLKDAADKGHKLVQEHRAKFLLVHSSSGFKHALKEVMADPAVVARLGEVKAAGETRLLQQFTELMGTDPDRAFYGYKHVKMAADNSAIEALLVSDNLFRSFDNAERRRYIALVEQVKGSGAEVRVFSSLHVTGEQLNLMTGVAAVLRFPMPEIDEVEAD